MIFQTVVVKNPFRESIQFLREEDHKKNNPEIYKKIEMEVIKYKTIISDYNIL